MSEFRMPSLGADMEAGTLVEWLKNPGDQVKRGDIIAVVETQKGAIEIEIFEDGVIDRLLVEPGHKVPVGTPLALVRGTGAAEAQAMAPVTPPATGVTLPETPIAAPAQPQPAGATVSPVGTGGLRISPVAARRAAALGIDVREITGSGPGGAITLRDVERAAATPPLAAPVETPAAVTEAPTAGAMRQAIAAAMSRSKREIPHYYLGTSIDMSAALAWLEATNKARPVAGRLLPGVLLLKVVALALRKVPDLNGHWVKGTFRPGTGIHVGWATSLRAGGLVAPAIHHADGKPLDVLMAEMRDVVGRARRGGLRSSELGDPTVTVTNLGETGVETVYGVIFPPQVALVGFGRMAKRPWCVDGAVMARPVVEATLSADHRASDGHKGALFLATVNGLLQKPEEL